MNLEQRVQFLPPTDSISRLYAAADVFVLPSISEGLSNALLEAMSTGLAIFASRVGGTKEVVSDGRNGLLFDAADFEDLRRQLNKFLKTPSLAQNLGQAARQAVEEEYSLPTVAKRYIQEVYN